MDYEKAVEKVYEHVNRNEIDRAVMECLRIARHRKDYLYSAIFMRELYPNKLEVARALCDDLSHLKKETQELVLKKSYEYWETVHTLDFSITGDDERKVFLLGVGEIEGELVEGERSIADLQLPSGMNPFDTAAFHDRYANMKAQMRLRLRAVRTIRERVRTRCLNYAIQIEREVVASRKAVAFVEDVEAKVNNFFRARSDDVYQKLQAASRLASSRDSEDLALALTEVRRSLKAVADLMLPPSVQPVRCADGKERLLGEEQYLNRLEEFVRTQFKTSTARDVLEAELHALAAFVRRLNDLASKGVHASASAAEAKQGAVGLYLFLYNMCSYLEQGE